MEKSIHLEIIGTGKPLILLHGWGWHSGIWKPLIPQLAEHYQLFLIDLPGCGKSPLTITDYSFESIANLIFSVVPNSAAWLGWSLGGMLAWWVAIHYPEKIKFLTTVAASPRFMQDQDWPGVTIPTIEKFSAALETQYETTLVDFLELQLRGSPNAAALFSMLKETLLSGTKKQTAALQGGLKLLRDTDLRSQVKSVRCPSLHVFGNLDTLVPVKVASLIQSNLALGQSHVIKPSGHIPFLSQQARFLELLLTASNSLSLR
jgi:pimeloyl-[acyl-carrier protein] methyl ester esterase